MMNNHLDNPLDDQSDHAIATALTYDDVLLTPRYTDFHPNEADTSSPLTSSITLHKPFISAAMDSVTTAPMAIAMAHAGGLGVIHKNMPIKKQAQQVSRVKKFESGIIANPITLSANTTAGEALKLANKHSISGFPVVKTDNTLIGIVTRRDLRYIDDAAVPIAKVMTPREKLVVVEENQSDIQQQRTLLHKHRIERLLVINNKNDFQLAGMITVKDMSQSEDFPLASRDQWGRLLVAAAIGADDRAFELLIENEVDILVVDTAHGHSKAVIDQVKRIKHFSPDTQVIAGNIVTAKAALDLIHAGADAVKVGIGPGSICTTRIVTGVGYPQISAIFNIAKALRNTNIGIIADGGIRFSGDIAKAIAAGASAVMMGSCFAGTDEAPGDIEYYQGRPYKSYRGMGSIGAMSETYGSSDRYLQKGIEQRKLVPEGIEGRVPYKGSVHSILHQFDGGLKSCMGYTGCRTISSLQKNAQFVQVSSASMRESHVHDVSITKEAPNYQI